MVVADVIVLVIVVMIVLGVMIVLMVVVDDGGCVSFSFVSYVFKSSVSVLSDVV